MVGGGTGTQSANGCWKNSGAMHLRTASTCNAAVVTSMPAGTTMTPVGDDTLGECNGKPVTWHRVHAGNHDGWVAHTKLLKSTHCTHSTHTPPAVSTSSTNKQATCVDTVVEGKYLCAIDGCVVAKSIGQRFANFMNAAAAAGHGMDCSASFRTRARQIELRTQNCGGASHYNIYQKSSTECSPPTAIPGRSNHEKGLALDLNCLADPSAPFGDTACFTWMQTNAATFGFKNLPSEPWHWSVDGR